MSDAPTERTIVITFPDTATTLEFEKRLADIRARNPTWRVTGNTQLTPHPPSGASPRVDLLAEFVAQQQGPRALSQDDVDAVSAASSRGNEPGAAPTAPQEGQRVELVVAPYGGQRATIVRVRGRDSFQVRVDSGPLWWCSRDDVLTLPAFRPDPPTSDSAELPPVGPLQEENRRLRVAVAEFAALLDRRGVTPDDLSALQRWALCLDDRLAE